MVLVEFFLLFRRIRSAFRRRRFIILLGLIAGVLAVGTIGLHETDGKSYWDSFYWTVVTIATIGYGDIYPVSFWARIVFFFVVIVGIGTFATALTELASYFMERKLLEMRGLHRAQMQSHTIIVGYDEGTEELLHQLKERNLEAIVVAENVDATELFAKGIKAVSGDPRAAATLERAGIANASAVLIPSVGDESAVMVALKAKQLNPKVHVVATCLRREDLDIMKDASIDVVVPRNQLLGELLAEAVLDSKAVDFVLDILEKEGGIDMNEIRVDKPTTVGDLSLRPGEKAVVVYRDSHPISDFRLDTPLAAGDLVITFYTHPIERR